MIVSSRVSSSSSRFVVRGSRAARDDDDDEKKRMFLKKKMKLSARRNVMMKMNAMERGGRGDLESSDTKRAYEIWKTCDAVCFDVDSTVIDHEGIDKLAEYLGKGEEVARVTTQAMNGEIPFEKALFYRLNAMKCSKEQMKEYLEKHPVRVSPGFRELREKLREKGKAVYLVSGGFRQMIHPIAEYLDIPVPTNVWANNLLYNEDGSMNEQKPFDDENEFTWRAGGKALAVAHVKKTGNFKTVVMVGDGATDVEARAKGGADIVIGYGGTVRRASVEKSADLFVMDFETLEQAL